MDNKNDLKLSQLVALTIKEVNELAVYLKNEYRIEPAAAASILVNIHEQLTAEVMEYGVRVFSDEGKFKRWLDQPHELFGGQTPRSLLSTVDGLRMIRDELGRIEHGVV